MTDERIGRSMKKCVNTACRAYCFAAPALAPARRPSPRPPRPRPAILTGWPGTTLQHAFDDHAVAGVQAARR